MMKSKLVYCESVHATSVSPWHIRETTEAGLKLGGGIDAPALCGRNLHSGWDLNTEVSVQSIFRLGPSVCSGCADEAYVWFLRHHKPGLLKRVKTRLHI